MATTADPGPPQIAVPRVAETRALGTAELLEAILIRLPTRDLLLAQGVSTTWRDAIVASIRCQKALFLIPCNAQDMPTGHQVVQLGAHIHQIQVSDAVLLQDS